MTEDAKTGRGAEWPMGGGTTGARLRSPAGALTPLGPAAAWPPALRASAEGLFASAFPALLLWGPEHRVLPNDAALPMLAGRPDALGQPLPQAWPEAWDAIAPLATRLRRPGEAELVHGLRLAGPGGSPARHLSLSLGALGNGAGGVGGLLATFSDAAEHGQVSLLKALPQLVWRSDPKGGWTWASPQWSAFTGQDEAESRGAGWLDALHPEDRERALAAWQRTAGGEPFEVEFRLRAADGGGYRWFQARATPLRDAQGRIWEWLGSCDDVDSLRRAEQRHRHLLGESEHRVRNTLAVMRSIIRRSVQSSETLEDLAMHLDGRVNAFARVQAAISRDRAGGLGLAQLIADELLAHAAREDKQVAMDGPSVLLRPKAAEIVGLAIHELATNAVKYGALSVEEGQIRVGWRIEPAEGGPRLVLDWQETGAPAQEGPARQGFGTDLLRRALPYDLHAEVRMTFGAGGLHCRIALPCADWVLPGPAAAPEE